MKNKNASFRKLVICKFEHIWTLTSKITWVIRIFGSLVISDVIERINPATQQLFTFGLPVTV